MCEPLQTLFNVLLIADKKRKTSKYFVVIFIFILLSLVSENDLRYYAFQTSLELNQTESVRLTRFITYRMEAYLTSIANSTNSKMLAKLRCSNHPLLIKVGRHHKMNADTRKCSLCDRIEDEIHFVTECGN